MGYEEFSAALTNRSLRTIRAELEFLADSSIITPQQLSTILAQLPGENTAARGASANPSAAMSQLSLNTDNPTTAPPNNGYGGEPFNEKANGNPYFDQTPTPQQQQQPPPAYPQAPMHPMPPSPAGPPPLTYATALYAYTATDAGDLNLQPNDRIAVTEYMNAEWWKGRNERTGTEGIFPRSYVRVEEKAMPMPMGAPIPQQSGYGNMPMDIAQQPVMGQPGQPPRTSKLQEGGKKFGKKLGNAAIFGAGATLGSDLVNSIF